MRCKNTQAVKRSQMKTRIEKVWRSRRGGLGRRRSLLVCDVFEAHVTERVKTALTRENTNLAVFPARINLNLTAAGCLFKKEVDGMDGEGNP